MVLLKNENINLMNRKGEILGGITVTSDSLMGCHPDLGDGSRPAVPAQRVAIA